MNAQAQSPSLSAGESRFLLRYESLFHPGRGMAFPCDERGRVELDALSDSLREHYLYARAVVGREYALPSVVAHSPH